MLLSNMELIATAPGGVAKLRELILTLAVQGKLVPQDSNERPIDLNLVPELTSRLINEGKMPASRAVAEVMELDEDHDQLPMNWRVIIANKIFIPRSGNSKLIKGKLFDLNGDGLYAGYSAAGQDVWLKTYEYEGAAIIISAVGARCGKAFLATGKWSAIANTHIVWPLEEVVLPAYGMLFLNDEKFWIRSGGAQPFVKVTETLEKSLWIPPLAEQSRIVTRVEALMRLCDALEAKGQLEATQHAQLISTLLGTLTASTTPEELADSWKRVAQHFDLLLDRPEAIDALEQTLLQLAVRGLLVPQDPTDEPASALLQKIRAEKDRLIATGQIRQGKSLPPISDEEKPFELPVGWEWVRVGDVIDLLNGYAFKSEWFKPAGIRLLRNVNVSHGHVDWSAPVKIDAVAAKSYEQFALRVGDIVLSLDRPIISTGLKYAVIREFDLPCLLLQRVARLTACACLSPDFLQLWLQSDFFAGTIDPGRSNGVPHISTRQVAGLAFALPPLAEQSRIVTRVTALRRLCADLRQRLAERQSVQARLAEALVQEVA